MKPARIWGMALIYGPVCAVALAACTPVPDLDSTIAPELLDADYPPLLPIDRLIASGPAPELEARAAEDELQGRLDSLRRRAEALDGPIVDAETQARMKGGVGG